MQPTVTQPILRECNSSFLQTTPEVKPVHLDKIDPDKIQTNPMRPKGPDESKVYHSSDNDKKVGDLHKFPMNDDEIFYKNPIVLFGGRNWRAFFPDPTRMKANQVFNATMRFAIYLGLLLTLFKGSVEPILLPVFVGLLIVLGKVSYDMIKKRKIDPIHGHAEQANLPTPDNPFMNTLLTDVGHDKPKQMAARADEDECVNKMTEYHFNKNLFKEVGDLYNKNNSQNRFYTMPNTNEYGVSHGDTVTFANWLYNPPKPTCKEDTRYCNRLNDMNTRFPSFGKVGP